MKAPFLSYSMNAPQRTLARAVLFAVLLLLPAALHGQQSPPVILAFGDSLTFGLGVAERESYPSRLQEILERNGYPHRVINAGVSGETTAGGLRRIGWLLRQDPEIVILELGANDGLRGLPLPGMYSNLERIIKLCRERKVKVLLTGMRIPPNYGEAYTRQFEATFRRLAEQYKLNYMPFFLEGVAAKRELNQPDGLHPLGPGYRVVAEKVWKFLQPML